MRPNIGGAAIIALSLAFGGAALGQTRDALGSPSSTAPGAATGTQAITALQHAAVLSSNSGGLQNATQRVETNIEQPERAEPVEAPEKVERPEAAERPEIVERPERVERPEIPERPERVERPELPDRADRG